MEKKCLELQEMVINFFFQGALQELAMILGGLKYHRAVLKESSSIHCTPKESSGHPKGNIVHWVSQGFARSQTCL